MRIWNTKAVSVVFRLAQLVPVKSRAQHFTMSAKNEAATPKARNTLYPSGPNPWKSINRRSTILRKYMVKQMTCHGWDARMQRILVVDKVIHANTDYTCMQTHATRNILLGFLQASDDFVLASVRPYHASLSLSLSLFCAPDETFFFFMFVANHKSFRWKNLLAERAYVRDDRYNMRVCFAKKHTVQRPERACVCMCICVCVCRPIAPSQAHDNYYMNTVDYQALTATLHIIYIRTQTYKRTYIHTVARSSSTPSKSTTTFIWFPSSKNNAQMQTSKSWRCPSTHTQSNLLVGRSILISKLLPCLLNGFLPFHSEKNLFYVMEFDSTEQKRVCSVNMYFLCFVCWLDVEYQDDRVAWTADRYTIAGTRARTHTHTHKHTNIQVCACLIHTHTHANAHT